jgi:5-hydroxyisourate hydrolase
MSAITTHVLDTSRGRPAAGLAVVLEQRKDGIWVECAQGSTNGDGRIPVLLPDGETLLSGVYRLRFATADYFAALGIRGFYPEVQVTFQVDDSAAHYHVPLLLSPFGYCTYRGS